MWRFLLFAHLALYACNGNQDDTGDTQDTTDSGDSGDTDPVTSPRVDVTGAVLVRVGESVTLTATTTNGQDSGYAWSSSDPTIATVSASGDVFALRGGQVTITATGADTNAWGSLGVAAEHYVPYYDLWSGSGHASYDAEAFVHWDEEGEVPATCSKCHTTTGYRDFIGDDGTAADSSETAHPTGQVIECQACHNATAQTLDHVVFPSGVVVEDLGPEARCMTCHQGRSSKTDVDEAIASAGSPGEDTVSTALTLDQIHYYAAGATLLANVVKGGYEYDHQLYDARFRHVEEKSTCVLCHDPHSLEFDLQSCGKCHDGVQDREDLHDVRMAASFTRDYDGDGDLAEGLYYEVEGLRGRLYTAMQDYSTQIADSETICFGDAYPYFFNDSDQSGGACSATEAVFANSFKTWTPRLLKAGYNYLVATKDPGAYAHNGKYILELLRDSFDELNGALTAPEDLSTLVRGDAGHFDGASEAARHWDEDEDLSPTCSKCHGGAPGLHFYLQYGVNIQHLEQANGLECETCHTEDSTYQTGTATVLKIDKVTYPSGITITIAGDANNVCKTCHSGRSSKATVDQSMAGGTFKFQNVHYLPAGATWHGTDAKVGYEYDHRTYLGSNMHPVGIGSLSGCIDCHNPGRTEHSFLIEDTFDELCILCHGSVAGPEDIRGNGANSPHRFDNDGDGTCAPVECGTGNEESLVGELEGLRTILGQALNDYSFGERGTAICHVDAYPYWAIDTRGDAGTGSCTSAEAGGSYPSAAWDAALVKATYNYQFYLVDPGAYAHNFAYVAQLLIDSAEELITLPQIPTDTADSGGPFTLDYGPLAGACRPNASGGCDVFPGTP